MRKPVLVCVCGEQRCPGAETETTELRCKGLLECRAGLWRLLYEEDAPAGETSCAFYELSTGSLTLTVETDAVAAELDGDGGTLELRYRLTGGEETVSVHRLLFRIVPRGEEPDVGMCG